MEVNLTNFVNISNLGTIVELMEVLIIIFFLVYSLFSIREVNMMNKALGTPLAPRLQAIARAQVYLSLAALAFFIVVLVVK